VHLVLLVILELLEPLVQRDLLVYLGNLEVKDHLVKLEDVVNKDHVDLLELLEIRDPMVKWDHRDHLDHLCVNCS
jgi:hypothetical protein